MSTETMLLAICGGGLSLIGKFILDAIKSHVDATKANTTAIAVLNSKIEGIVKHSDQIPEFMKDLNNYYQRLKVIEAKLGVDNDK